MVGICEYQHPHLTSPFSHVFECMVCIYVYAYSHVCGYMHLCGYMFTYVYTFGDQRMVSKVMLDHSPPYSLRHGF